eukprot:3572284-Amphidinium_carterae.2
MMVSVLKELRTTRETGAPEAKRAVLPTLAMMIPLELSVSSERPSCKWAIAWTKLVKGWACMRADDMVGVDSSNMAMTTQGLTLKIVRSKTTGLGKAHRVVEAHVSTRATFTHKGWLQEAGYGRAVLGELCVPQAGGIVVGVVGHVLAGLWTEHSEQERDLLGRWTLSKTTSKEYVLLAGTVARRAQQQMVEAICDRRVSEEDLYQIVEQYADNWVGAHAKVKLHRQVWWGTGLTAEAVQTSRRDDVIGVQDNATEAAVRPMLLQS